MNIEDSRKAVYTAIEFYKSLLPSELTNSIMLESIKRTDDMKYYDITLSRIKKNFTFNFNEERHYSTFIIDAKDFALISMGMLDDK